MIVSIQNAEHYVWGEICDGWHLLKRDDMRLIQERVPANGSEVMHYYNTDVHFLVISVPSTRGDRVNL